MAVPKRRQTRARTHKRRTHYKAAVPTLVPCPQCREQRLPHRVCPACGYYEGRRVVEVKES